MKNILGRIKFLKELYKLDDIIGGWFKSLHD